MSQRTKVIHIITRLDMGGSAQNTLLTCLLLDHRRYQVALIKGSDLESAMTEAEARRINHQLASAQEQGVEIIDLPSLVRRISPTNDFRALFSLTKLIRRMKPPIVHTHTSKAGVLGRLAGWLARVPFIVHTPHGHVFYGHFSSFFSKVYLLVERVLDRITHDLIALTRGEARDYVDLKVADPKKISIIPSGVDLRRFSKEPTHRQVRRKKLGLPTDGPVVGFVGWLWPIKGVTYLVEAMAEVVQQHPTTLLALVGKGDEEASLKSQVKALNLGDNVLFLGWRPNIEKIMPSFDLLVLPSLNEGMGRVLVEAMALGLPIVASRVGGIPDLVKHGKNGLLVPPADPTALAGAISELLNDRNKRERLGAAGKKMCEQFSVEAMVEQIDSLYQKLLARGS